VINAAAYTQVDRAESEPEQAYAINRDAVSQLATACNRRGLPLLHVSTDYVYSGAGEGDYREDDAPAPRSVYGESKAAGDEALRAVLSRHIILRTSWVFSATGNNFVKTMLRLGKEREELGIVDDQRGCPTSARSIAGVLLQIAERYLDGETIPWGTYHFCNSPATTWHDFATQIFALAGGYEHLTLRRISTPEYPTPAVRPMNSTLNCDKLKAHLAIELPEWHEELRLVLAQLDA
jgi:dTDP-4-dehydrorhamnose reductase